MINFQHQFGDGLCLAKIAEEETLANADGHKSRDTTMKHYELIEFSLFIHSLTDLHARNSQKRKARPFIVGRL